MSIQYHMEAVCDGCGAVIAEATVPVRKIEPQRWDWERKWRKQGVMIRRMFKGPTKIYCQPCADGNPKKLTSLQTSIPPLSGPE